MKKTLLILMIACSAFAQNNSKWADSAAVWHYTYNFAGVGYARYSYVSDTLLQGKMCQKIIEQTQVKIQTSPGIFMLQPVYSGATMYVYKSNDSVFTYRNNNFYLAFKTNSTVGDIWDLGVFDNLINNHHAFVKVDSVFYDNYNGVLLRNMKIYSCDSFGNQIFNQPQGTPASLWLPYIALFNNSIINEKFGPNVLLSGINNALLDEWFNEVILSDLLCFQSDSFQLYQENNNDCNNGILTEINNIKTNEKINFYPNPTTNRIYLSNVTLNSSIIIYNNLGQLQLFLQNVQSSILDISTLSNGIYSYSISSQEQEVVGSGKFIKQ